MSKHSILKVSAALLLAVLGAAYIGGHSLAKGASPRHAPVAHSQARIPHAANPPVAHAAVGQPPCTWAPQDSPGDACGLCGNGGPGTGSCTLPDLRSNVAWCARAWKHGSPAFWPNDDKCHDEAIFLAGLGHAPPWYAGCIGGAATGARFIEGEPWTTLVGCLLGVGFAYIF
jgi:hypothetical protein